MCEGENVAWGEGVEGEKRGKGWKLEWGIWGWVGIVRNICSAFLFMRRGQ